MSRTKKGQKGCGWDYWGKRPIGMGDHGTEGKRVGIQRERAIGKRETAKESHVCRPPSGCCCYSLGLEPNEDCPTHGYPDMRRCEDCGRYFKQKTELSSRVCPEKKEGV